MNLTTLLPMLKGSTPLDLIVYLVVILISAWIGKTEYQKFNKKRKKNEPDNRSAHLVCMMNVEKLNTEKQEIKNKLIVKDQMKKVEDALEEMMRLYRDEFYDKLKSVCDEKDDILIDSLDVRHYDACLEVLEKRYHKDMHSMMRDNGLAEKNEEGISLYIEKKMEILNEVSRIVFKTYYGDSEKLVISRAKLHGHHKNLRNKIESMFSAMIRSCRIIAIEYKEKLIEIEEKLTEIRENPCPRIGE